MELHLPSMPTPHATSAVTYTQLDALKHWKKIATDLKMVVGASSRNQETYSVQIFRWDSTKSAGSLVSQVTQPRAAILPCPESWQGPLDAFLSEFTLRNWIRTERALGFHRDLLDYARDGSALFSRDLTGNDGPRGVAVDGFPPGYRLFGCDNAPAVWTYTQLKTEAPLELRSTIERRLIPLREVFGCRPGEERYEWATCNPDPLNLRGSSPNGGRWKLCHIYSVSKDLPLDLEWQKRRFIRLLHPFNQFLFPRPSYKNRGYYPIGQDLGEDVTVCRHVAEAIRARVGKTAWQEFLDAIGANEHGRIGTKVILSVDAPSLALRYQDVSAPRESRLPQRKRIAPQRSPANAPLSRNASILQPGDLVVRAYRHGTYNNQWEGPLLKVLHTHRTIRNVVEARASSGRPIFVQDQDQNPPRISCFGHLNRIEELADGSFQIHLDQLVPCDLPGSSRQPPGYYYWQ